MKQQFFFGLIILLLLLLMPLFGLGGQLAQAFNALAQDTAEQGQLQTAPANELSPPSEKKAGSGGEVISVMRGGSGQIEELQMDEYLLGVLAAEMSANSHEEALKAQAVASFTYARYRTEIAGIEAISDSGTVEQEYISREERQRRWGGSFDLNEAKLQSAVAAVRGETVTYAGEPILAAFHAVSHGKTESAANYWGGTDHPYLQGIESPGDRLAPDYAKTVSFTPEEMKGALQAAAKEKNYTFALDDGPVSWFEKPTRGESGMVREIAVGGQALTGRALREILDLRSADFTVDYDEKDAMFAVTTRGYGHSVGMSQYGADFMARQGSGYKEILGHYYQGCEIK